LSNFPFQNWSLIEQYLLVLAHQAASESEDGNDMTGSEFWKRVEEALKFQKSDVLARDPDASMQHEDRLLSDRAASQCMTQWRSNLLPRLNKFTGLLVADKKKNNGREGKSGEDREQWYSRVNQTYRARNNGKDFKLYNFQENCDNEPIDLPSYCISNYPRFADLSAGDKESEKKSDTTDGINSEDQSRRAHFACTCYLKY
jgi:hypothetical protein